MKMQVHVEVTQEDIDQGCAADTEGTKGGCMVYRAFQRATEGAFRHVHVYNTAIEFGEARSTAQLARFSDMTAMIRRIAHFDSGRPVQPFAFDIDLPIEITA